MEFDLSTPTSDSIRVVLLRWTGIRIKNKVIQYIKARLSYHDTPVGGK
jgi:hypothetical protein